MGREVKRIGMCAPVLVAAVSFDTIYVAFIIKT